MAVFCLFGYRSSFSVMQKSIMTNTGWTAIQAFLGYCVMMTVETKERAAGRSQGGSALAKKGKAIGAAVWRRRP
jgi:hypothetical protein